MAGKRQLQHLGGGTYRVTGARVSPTTGKYVTRSSEVLKSTAKTGTSTSKSAAPAPSARQK